MHLIWIYKPSFRIRCWDLNNNNFGSLNEIFPRWLRGEHLVHIFVAMDFIKDSHLTYINFLVQQQTHWFSPSCWVGKLSFSTEVDGKSLMWFCRGNKLNWILENFHRFQCCVLRKTFKKESNKRAPTFHFRQHQLSNFSEPFCLLLYIAVLIIALISFKSKNFSSSSFCVKWHLNLQNSKRWRRWKSKILNEKTLFYRQINKKKKSLEANDMWRRWILREIAK